MKFLILAFLTHFVADFLLQTRDMGTKKSSHWGWLSAHIGIIFLAFLPFGWKFALANALIHAAIDRNIWNLYKWSVHKRLYDVGNGKLGHSLMRDNGEWGYYNDHLFYSTIGLDQMLHSVTIVVLWGLLK